MFRYQPEKIQIGTVYRYCKSNLDGSWPAVVSIYLASRTHIEVLKREPESQVMAYVAADMNWDIFSPDHIDSYHMLPDGLLRAQMNLSHADKADHIFAGGMAGSVAIDLYPTHNYNFDFISLNLSFRHLIEPEGRFEIGVTMPDFAALSAGKFGVLYGRAAVEYVGDEERSGGLCRKYRIGGAGLGDQSGWIWVDKAGEFWVDFEHPLADNPAWNSFKFKLLTVETMMVGEWNHYMAAERERAQTYRG